MSRQSLKLLSPLRVRGSQSKIKRAGFVLFLASGATTFVINSYNTECELHYDRNPFNNQVVRSCRELNKVAFIVPEYCKLIIRRKSSDQPGTSRPPSYRAYMGRNSTQCRTYHWSVRC